MLTVAKQVTQDYDNLNKSRKTKTKRYVSVNFYLKQKEKTNKYWIGYEKLIIVSKLANWREITVHCTTKRTHNLKNVQKYLSVSHWQNKKIYIYNRTVLQESCVCVHKSSKLILTSGPTVLTLRLVLGSSNLSTTLDKQEQSHAPNLLSLVHNRNAAKASLIGLVPFLHYVKIPRLYNHTPLYATLQLILFKRDLLIVVYCWNFVFLVIHWPFWCYGLLYYEHPSLSDWF